MMMNILQTKWSLFIVFQPHSFFFSPGSIIYSNSTFNYKVFCWKLTSNKSYDGRYVEKMLKLTQQKNTKLRMLKITVIFLDIFSENQK